MVADATPTPETTDESRLDRFTPESWGIFVTALVMGVIIGGFAAWATANLGVAPVAFVVGLIGGTWFLNKKRLPSEAIGSGLYITALVMILTPILFYLPTIIGEGEAETAEGAGTFIGSVLGLVIWGFVFLLVAIVTAAIGYFFKRRAGKKLDAESVSEP